MPERDPGPSVKDKDQYETLRQKGNSKEKSARVANASAGSSRSATGRKGGHSPAYEDWSKDDLYQKAKDISLEGRSGMSKGELIEALRNH